MGSTAGVARGRRYTDLIRRGRGGAGGREVKEPGEGGKGFILSIADSKQ